MIFLTLWAIAIGFSIIHVSIARLWRHPLERDTLFLLYQLIVALGLGGLVAFGGHAFRPAEIAAKIGWPPSPNFQFELGGFGLGVLIGSLLSPLIRSRHYWLGVAIAPSVFLIMAGANHLRDVFAGNLAPYNAVPQHPIFSYHCASRGYYSASLS